MSEKTLIDHTDIELSSPEFAKRDNILSKNLTTLQQEDDEPIQMPGSCWKAGSFVVLFILWPFLKLAKQEHDLLTGAIYFTYVFSWFGLFLGGYSIVFDIYFVLLYGAMIWAEMNSCIEDQILFDRSYSLKGLLARAKNFSDWKVLLSTVHLESPDCKTWIFGALWGVVFVFGFIFVFKTGTFADYLVFFCSWCLDAAIVGTVWLIQRFYASKLYMVNDAKKCSLQFFRQYDAQNGIEVLIYFRKNSHFAKVFASMFETVETMQVFAFFYLFVIWVVNLFIQFESNQDQFTLGLVLLMSVYAFFMKVETAKKMVRVNQYFHNKFKRVNEQISIITSFPELFITKPNSPEFDVKKVKDSTEIEFGEVKLTGEKLIHRLYIDLSRADDIFRRLQNREDLKVISIYELSELMNNYTELANSRFEFIKEEYERFYETLEYKVAGTFEVTENFYARMLISILTSILSAVLFLGDQLWSLVKEASE